MESSREMRKISVPLAVVVEDPSMYKVIFNAGSLVGSSMEVSCVTSEFSLGRVHSTMKLIRI